MINPDRANSTRRSGFTLIELLVVITSIAVLASLAMAGVQAARQVAHKTQAVSAARTLITAYLAASDPDTGRFLGGYDRTIASVPGPNGIALSGPAAERYPWRLAPYLANGTTGTLLTGDIARQIDPTDTYMVSCFPAFGINYIFVGGDIQSDGSLTYPADCITRIGDSASVLVFASACGNDDMNGGSAGKKINGYCILTPPNLTGPMWSSAAWSDQSAPSDYGNVDARYAGEAVCAFLDGSVRMESIDALRDMRLWCRGAVQTGNPQYLVTNPAAHGGRLQ